MSATAGENQYGPQYPGDNSFTAKMRSHQSWWRHSRLGVTWGNDRKGTPYGNYLKEDDAKRGLNFLTRAIHQCAHERIKAGPGVEPFRCMHNLLSSQPMAFNLFGPLCVDPHLAVRLLNPLLPGGVRDAHVSMEWAPCPKSEYLADATSFDIVVRYTTNSGARALAGIETKLTEPFSPKTFGLNDHHTERYYHICSSSTVWLDPKNTNLTDRGWNQIWRNHLLVESIRQKEPGLLGCQVVVHHPSDESCAKHIKKYIEFLSAPDQTFRRFTLADLVATWRPLLHEQPHMNWLNCFEDRYLNLALSDGIN